MGNQIHLKFSTNDDIISLKDVITERLKEAYELYKFSDTEIEFIQVLIWRIGLVTSIVPKSNFKTDTLGKHK